MPAWHLILDDALDGPSNMAIDAALLEEVERSANPRTIVRFYRWKRPTISLGRNQKVEAAVDLSFCEAHGVDVVHRPTGGRAVLHDDEMTYAVASNDTESFGDTIYANYKSVSEALCEGFRRLGIPALLAPETRHAPTSVAGVDLPCFVSPSRYELTVDGRKIVGSAQRRLRRSFLQHGSMPIECDREKLAVATRMRDSRLLYQEMAGLAEFLPERPSIENLTDALIAGFKTRFAIEFQPRLD
ncbi:MAG TPA: lipoate--protein ligase family protein [Terriglobia bacterium]|nr:lipoate--protein ligase family protein [Terriglobia bacterium]